MLKIMIIFAPVVEWNSGAEVRPEFVKADVVMKMESMMEYDVPLPNGYDELRW
jgi:hypothetical protein